MRAAIENHIREVEAFYRPLILQSAGRLIGGDRLFEHFNQAVRAFRLYGRRQVSGVIERVNELAVAHKLLADPDLATATVAYEPEIVAGPRFDFVIRAADGQTHFVEVKTVSPQSANNGASWRKPTYRRRLLSNNTTYVVTEDAMGAEIFGNAFAARSSFLKYAGETEVKLAAHAAVEPSQGILVICGDGFGWDVDLLEDFAEFYQSKQHRADDGFGRMERNAIATGEIVLSHTLAGLAVLIRQQDALEPSQWGYPVKGPSWG